jgi:trimeric autotransporter adhesin
VTIAHLNRRVTSGGATGYYDTYPTGDLNQFGIDATASLLALGNTWKVTKGGFSGATMDILFGQGGQSTSDPTAIPLPNLFDVNLSFDGSVNVLGIDLASLEFRSDYVKVNILGVPRTYTAGNLDILVDDLVDSGVAPEAADNFVSIISTAMIETAKIEIKVRAIFEAFDTADFSDMQSSVNVDLTSSMAVSPMNGTPVNIGPMVNANGTVYNDMITGSNSDNLLFGDNGNDSINGQVGFDTLVGGDGDDTIFGTRDIDPAVQTSRGHNEIHAGIGTDSVDAGDGADLIFDNGATAPLLISDEAAAREAFASAYDATGNDTLRGGKGSDILVSSGGTDSLYGGADDDTYFITGRAAISTEATDKLEIHVADTAAEGLLGFGHDLILGTGLGVDRLVFDGISSTDIELRYNFESFHTGVTAYNFNPLFGWGLLDPLRQEISNFVTLGSLEIRVLSMDSSVTIEQVSGAYNIPGPGGSILPYGAISLPFLLQFADGFLNVTTKLLQQGTNATTFFNNLTLSSTALGAVDSFEAERAEIEDTVAGSTGNDSLSGSNAANLLRGLAEDDALYGLGGDDWLEGGLGADTLDGGNGLDTVTYESASSAIGIALGGTSFYPGEAIGDVLISIENVTGGAYDDRISGDSGANVLTGGAGADTIEANDGDDVVYGGIGDDSIADRNGGRNQIFGGDGNDFITSAGGFGKVSGGDGDDFIFTGGYTVSFFPTVIVWGNDTIDGGAGVDTVEFGYADNGLVIDMVAGRAVYGTSGTIVTFTGVENVNASARADTIFGDNNNNVIKGKSGNDILYGGGGSDTIWGESGQNEVFGGIGIDTARIEAARTDVTFSFIDGGIRGTTGSNAFTIFKDVEFVQFNDVTLTYNELAAGLQTAFDVIDDYERVNEGITPTISLLANDLPFAGSPMQLVKINGAAVTSGQVIRLASGATITIFANGNIQFDQAGAYAWLNTGETATETLTYTATDGTGVEKVASVTLVIDGLASAADQVHVEDSVVIVSSDTANAAATRIANFDIGRGAVVINDVLIDPNALPAGVTIQEIDGSTFLIFGDDAVILTDVSLAAWQYRSSQRAAGGAGNDSLLGTTAADVLLGAAGNDTISGNGGRDVISGGAGNDSISLGAGLAFGDLGDDSISAGAGNDRLFGNAGNDTLSAGSGRNSLYGGDNDDILYGGAGEDSLYGGSGNDTLRGSSATSATDSGGKDYIDGGDGIDLLLLDVEERDMGLNLGARIDLAAGWITWNGPIPEEQIVNIEGAYGGFGNDTIIGTGQANRLDGSGGNDLLIGADGNDTLTDGIGNDTIYGDNGDDYIYDTSGDDQIFGGLGNDTLLSYSGTDLIDGGAGTDTLDLSFTAAALTVNLDTGIVGGTSTGSVSGVENVVGSNGANGITGSVAANLLDGRNGDDSLSGLGGNDTLLGGIGNDILDGGSGVDDMTGGAGNDTYVVDDIGDTVTEIANEGTDTVQTTIDFTLAVTFENLVLLVAGRTGTGNSVANSLTGSLGADTLIGLAGNDNLFGGDGADRLDAGDGDDTLASGLGDDTVFGGTGNDRLNYEANIGSIAFAASVNSLTLSSTAAGIDVISNDVETIVIDGPSYTYAQLVNLFTSTGANGVVNGTANADTINLGFADAGGESVRDSATLADTVYAGAGNDVVSLFAGNDVAHGGIGNDTVTGGEGNDSITGNEGNDVLAGDNGNDTLVGSDGLDSLTGGDGEDLLQGGAGNDTIAGGVGNDTLDSGADADTLFGGLGNDTYNIEGTASGDIVDEIGGDGIDTVFSTTTYTLTSGVENLTLVEVVSSTAVGTGNTLANIIIGNSGNNILNGGDGNDTLNGGAGDDTLFGQAGDDSMAGGLGNDSYYVTEIGDVISELSNAGFDSVFSSISFTLGATLEYLTLVGSGALNGKGNTGANLITGTSGDNLLEGLDGNDTITGGDGNDTLDGGVGVDLMEGGQGNDTYIVQDLAADSVIELAAGGIDHVISSTAYGLADNVENLTLVGSTVNGGGNALANIVTGNAVSGSDLDGYGGNDTIYGGAGNDTIYGGAGTDVLIGGAGDDRYIVDASSDVVTELANGGVDTIETEVTLTALAADVENLLLRGSAAISGAGNDLANILTGNTAANGLFGGVGNDSISGGSGNDTLDGGLGTDTLVGGAGDDTFVVDAATDVVTEAANSGIDTVNSSVTLTLGTNFENLTLTGTALVSGTGNAVANSLIGNGVSNTLSGLDGNDTLDGGAGSDTLIGGLGDDIYIVDSATDVVVEAAASGVDLVLSTASATLAAEVEHLTLTGTALQGVGNALHNLITGNLEANLLSGLDGSDTLNAGDGNDTLNGGTGSNLLNGGAGDDRYIVTTATDVITELAGAGIDTVETTVTLTLAAEVENLTLAGTTAINGTGNGLANVIVGNVAANGLFGGTGNDTLNGGDGNDTLDGGAGTDSMTGGQGNDTFIVDAATDVIVELAGGGTDLVQTSVSLTLGTELENLTLTGTTAISGTGNGLANVLTGNTGANNLSGGTGNDTLFGGDGSDTLDGGTGTDSMAGGLGNDTFVVDATTDIVIEAASGGTDLVLSSVTLAALAANVENLTLAGAVAINGTGNTLANVITGNTAANLLAGGDGNDTINGGDGNDTLDGGLGTDSMVGGLGDDTYVVSATTDVIVEAAAGGTDLVQSAITLTLGAELENLTLTGTTAINGTGNGLANVITGNTGANNLAGGTGNDTVFGGDGNDTLDGGSGTDSLTGGLGNDTYLIDAATDVIVEATAGGTDTVQSTVAIAALALNVENLTLLGAVAINGTGNTLANVLTGNVAANLLAGGDGNDTINAGDGNDALDGGLGTDSMVGGLGNDTYIVDATTDIAIEAASGGTDLVQSSVTFTLGTEIENLTLIGTTAVNGTGNGLANVITGNVGANSLFGGTGNDTLIGGDGNDTLDGGVGTDSLTGGLGNDTFVVDATTDVLIEAASQGTDLVQSAVAWTLGANFENLTLTGTTGLAGTGNTLANILTGNSGANNLSGFDGNDTLIGGGGNDSLNGGNGADQFVFNSTTSGIDVIADFNELNGGGEEGDVLRFDALRVGTFVYRGTSAFTGGSDNSEARVSGSQVLVDTNGDGTADITITLTGLTAATQLATADFVFV